jgi:hypothetical protein
MRKFLTTAFAVTALFSAQFFSMTSDAQAQPQLRPYRATDAQVKSLITRIESNTNTFRTRLNNALDVSPINGSRSEDEAVRYVNDFEQSTDTLRDRVTDRSITTTDVEELLSSASYIDKFMRDNRLTTTAQNQWSLIRTDLNTLAGYYRVSWNWANPRYTNNNNNNGNYPNNNGNNNGSNNGPGPWNNNNGPGRGNGGGWNQSLTGTYRLNRSASDDVQAAIDKAYAGGINNNNNNNGNGRNGNGRGQNGLVRRLTPPDMMAIQKNGREITIASDMAPQVTVTADGVAKTETSNNGRSIRTTTTSTGNGVTINYEGDRMNDFYVSFMPERNNQLKVMRRVYLEGRNETITVTSVYDRTSQTADWSSINTRDTYNNGNYNNGNYPNNNNNNYPGDNSNGEFIVPDGTRIVGSLDSAISTKDANDGERFSLKVISPSQYSDAVITGYISGTERSGRVSGRANITMNFEQIRLRNGKTYKFAGTSTEVRLPNGEKVNVSNEGTVKDSNQGTKTGIRAGIGAGLGAIIGAIAGGGSGAAIGAAVGAGAGAGSVVIQGRDDLNLSVGTEFVILASAPRSVAQLR